MIYRQPRLEEYEAYEALAQHPIQSTAWGNFRANSGIDVVRLIGFDEKAMRSSMQVFFHKLPRLPWTIGNYSKGEKPTEVMLEALYKLGQEKKAIFIKLEPNVYSPPHSEEEMEQLKNFILSKGCELGRAHFIPYTFILDLTQSEDQILGGMKQKTRYNIKVAQKHGVEIIEDSTNEGFEDYIKLLQETTKRQGFYAHTMDYHRKMWQHMRGSGIAKLMKGVYKGETIVAWVLFHYKDVLHYPYGTSSRQHRNVMASNLMMWEVIRLGKAMGAKTLDMWGCLGPDPDKSHPWYGFHKFKEGYGGVMTKYVGSFDMVIDPNMYKIYRMADRWRWRWLDLRRKLPLIG